MSKKAEKEGASSILSVVPYYNKPSQKGIIEHFSAVAEAVDLPVILYNIPGRTGANMTVETAKYLTEKYENIVAIKQSFGDLDVITDFKLALPKDVAVYSGDDSLTLPMLSVGAHGVISVASHLFGKEINSMIRNFKTGDITSARNMHYHLYPIMKKLFMAPNPVPVKACLAKRGLLEEFVRSPLVTLDDAEKKELFKVLNSIKF
jgi:4-hydroxy-tetrahydrodipicolinate synthase